MNTNIVQKSYFLFTISLLSFSVYCTENLDLLYSTSFLKNYSHVNSFLKEQGFVDITIKTPDNFNLCGLFLSRPNATCNVIICAGFFPGKKEGMATFYDLLPKYCNILLFDARGHANSEGPFLSTLWRYGIDEHKDILGAISWLNNNNNLPIIIGGTCCGVFHAAHALIKLTLDNTLEQSHVKGLFFDSGWGSVMAMSQSSPLAHIKRCITKITAFLHRTKEDIEKRTFYQYSFAFAQRCFKMGHFICARPIIMQYEKITNLFDKIHHLKLPIFFIHSYDDGHAAPINVIKLSQLAPNKQCWWIKKSSHAKHYLVHQKEYKEKLTTFIESVI